MYTPGRSRDLIESGTPATLLLRRWAEELILPYDNLRADVDATVEVDHVIVDKTEAAG